MADVFLCHNTADTEQVEEIAKRLVREHVEVWLDKFNLIPGDRFTEKIEEALDACNSIAIFIGQTGRGAYQLEEFEYAVNVRGARGTRIIPVLLPGTNPDMITGFLRNRSRVQFRESLEEIEPFRMLLSGIRGIPLPEVKFASDDPGAPENLAGTGPPICPYRSLTAFDVSDHFYFCGRDRATAAAVEGVESVLDGAIRSFSIFGASGSGKSSLARAGVLWSLQNKFSNWTTVIIEPGPRPHATLAERMLKLIQEQVDGLTLKQHEEAYLQDANMLQRSIVGALGSNPAKRRLLLLVDQFEEVFTVCESQAARDAFIANLLTAAAHPSGMLVLLLCLRADFYGDCAKTRLAEIPSRQQILIGPMQRDELHSAIVDPAIRAGCEVEPGLVACLIRDCAEQPSPLPLLQIVLERLWQKRDTHGHLTLAEYERMSLEGAIDQQAEAVYDQLPEPQKKACKSLLLQLVEPLTDGRFTRRRISVNALLGSQDSRKDQTLVRTKEIEATLGTLAGRRARLITIRTDRTVPEVEISHEAIFRGWKRLAVWLDQAREFLAWKHRLSFALSDSKDPKTSGTFLTGSVLDRALLWLKERPDDHTGEEREFIEASLWRRRLKQAGIAAAVAALTGVLALGVSLLRKEEGIDQQVHEANEQLKDGHADMGLLLAYDAFRREKSQRTREALQVTAQSGPALLEADQMIVDTAMSTDGGTMAAATSDGVVVWSRFGKTGEVKPWSLARILQPATLRYRSPPALVSVNEDGTRIAAGSLDGQAMVWEGGSPAEGAPFSAGSAITSLAFARDGHLAVTTSNKEILFWKAGVIEKRGMTPGVASIVAVSPDSSTVTVGMADDGWIHSWHPNSGLWSDGLKHDEPVVSFIAYTSDGKSIGSGTRGGKIYRWNPADASHVLKIGDQNQMFISAAMDGTGLNMAGYTSQHSLMVLDAQGKTKLNLAGQQAGLPKVLLDSKGAFVALAAEDGIRIYELTDQALGARARIKLQDYSVSMSDCQQVLKSAAFCKADLEKLR